MLAIGAHIGPYKITSLLGTGGMGVVYRARDQKLGRDVAIKVLPAEVAHDPERLARLAREAHMLAALNHPHIATIYSLEESSGAHAIVMELVDGETLADRISRGPLQRYEALGIAEQIAEALESAHRDGIIHRDLKPANIKVTAGGVTKVLDFGLAKVIEPSAAAALAGSPTVTAAATEAGALLGTTAYMSPEQARGDFLDTRTDIWAFGAVLFEMLSGRRAFPGITRSDSLAAVLRAEPDWSQLPPDTPPSIHRLLRRCLAKDRRNRFQHMGDIRLEIAEILEGATAEPASHGPRSRSSPWVAAALTLVIAAAAAGLAIYLGAPTPREQRFEINTPLTTAFTSFAISPDGRTIAFVATFEGRRHLWLQRIGSVEPQPMPGTEGALNPFWSPAGRAIGFFADGKLKRTDLAGGSPEVVANAPVAAGGAWSEEEAIIFNPGPGVGLSRVSATGGEPRPITRLDSSRQVTHGYPIFLPDVDRFLFYVSGSPEIRGVHAGSLKSDTVLRLFDADAPAAFLPPDRLLFIQRGTLFARRFNLSTLEPLGEPVAVARNVAAVSASPSGVIVYRSVPAEPSSPRLRVLDRAGKIVRTYGTLQALSAEISPDGLRVAMHRQMPGNIDLWVLDLMRDISSRLTSDPAVEGFAIWSPDGTRLVFSEPAGLSTISAAGTGASRPLWRSGARPIPLDWSPDGRFILVRAYKANNTDMDVHALPLTADATMAGEPIPVANTSAEEREARFSADGRWIVYQSNETGRFEVYLRPFQAPGEKVRVTANGGMQARWPRQTGKELFYMALDGTLMVVPVVLPASGSAPDVAMPSALFSTNLLTAQNRERLRQEYDVFPDGQRLMMSEVAEYRTPLTVVLDWTPPEE
jgi:serine/threonine protein kinase